MVSVFIHVLGISALSMANEVMMGCIGGPMA